jgi:hypothetical protein
MLLVSYVEEYDYYRPSVSQWACPMFLSVLRAAVVFKCWSQIHHGVIHEPRFYTAYENRTLVGQDAMPAAIFIRGTENTDKKRRRRSFLNEIR